jgi:hypothetical protein
VNRQGEPFLSLVRVRFHRDGWVYEERYDGRRMLAFRTVKNDVGVPLRSGRVEWAAR